MSKISSNICQKEIENYHKRINTCNTSHGGHLNDVLFHALKEIKKKVKNNFIQMAASNGHAVANTIGPISKHIIDCVQRYFTNGFTNIVL